MELLTSTSDKVQVVTASAGAVSVRASFVDHASGLFTPGRTNTASITTATTTDVVASPGASTQRNTKNLEIWNTHASVSNVVIVQHTDGTTVSRMWTGTLLAGEGVIMNDDGDWTMYDVTGAIKAPTQRLDLMVTVASDVTNATTSFADVTGLVVALKSGKKYVFEAHLTHINNATTTGSRFGVNIGAAPTVLRISTIDTVTGSVTASVHSAGSVTALDTAVTAQTTGSATDTLAIISGFIQPSADGNFAIRCASEVAVAAGLIVRAGSWLWIREANS